MFKVTETNILPFFFNPVSRRRFWLPLMNNPSYHMIRKMVASSAPNNINNHHHDHGDGDPTFVVCLTYDRIIYCKITDKSWSLIKSWRGGSGTSDIAVIGNLLYVTGDEPILDDIRVYNLNSPTMATRNLVALDPKPFVSLFYDIYLAHDEVSGDLMLVVARYEHDDMIRVLLGGGGYKSIAGFRVTKIDRSRRSGGGDVRWVEVEDLGDCLIFLDQKYCRLIPNIGLQMMENVARNCIYFTDGTKMGVFCLSDKKIHSFHIVNMIVQFNQSGIII